MTSRRRSVLHVRALPALTLAAAAALAVAPPADVRRQERLAATTCTDTVSGAVESLVVPADATCTAEALVVAGTVTVERGATLQIAGSGACDSSGAGRFSVQGAVSVATGGSLLVQGTDVVLGSDVSAQNGSTISVVKTPCEGARGTVGGSVTARGSGAVTLLGFQVDGDVVVQRSGSAGIEIGTNAIVGTLRVERNTVRAVEQPSIFALHGNTVGRGMVVVGNDARGAFKPLFIGGNTVNEGHLVCENNVPEPTNVDVDTVVENIVVNGQKLGECAAL